MKPILLIVFVLSCACLAAAQSQPDMAEINKVNADVVSLYKAGKFDEAAALAAKVESMTEQTFGKNDVQTARALKNLGFIQNAKGDAKAESTLEKAADIFRRQTALDRPNKSAYAELLEVLGSLKAQRNLASSKDEFETALALREANDGPEAPSTVVSLTSLGNIAFWGRDYKKAAELYGRAFAAVEKNPALLSGMRSAVYHRTQCAYRKAEIEDQFEAMSKQYAAKSADDASAARSNPINGGVVNGKAIYLAKPAYPAEAKAARAQGTVTVQVLIGESGEVISACAVGKAHPALMESSEIAAYQAKFSPTTLGGTPVKVSGVITYNYVR